MSHAASLCCCDERIYRKCVHCQELEDRKEEMRVCSGWNWNCTPRECAEEARELAWSRRRIESAMKAFGFKDSYVLQVVYEFEIGE